MVLAFVPGGGCYRGTLLSPTRLPFALLLPVLVFSFLPIWTPETGATGAGLLLLWEAGSYC